MRKKDEELALSLSTVKDFGVAIPAHCQKPAIISHKSDFFRVMADYEKGLSYILLFHHLFIAFAIEYPLWKTTIWSAKAIFSGDMLSAP